VTDVLFRTLRGFVGELDFSFHVIQTTNLSRPIFADRSSGVKKKDDGGTYKERIVGGFSLVRYESQPNNGFAISSCIGEKDMLVADADEWRLLKVPLKDMAPNQPSKLEASG
jgi:hypothetical protein